MISPSPKKYIWLGEQDRSLWEWAVAAFGADGEHILKRPCGCCCIIDEETLRALLTIGVSTNAIGVPRIKFLIEQSARVTFDEGGWVVFADG